MTPRVMLLWHVRAHRKKKKLKQNHFQYKQSLPSNTHQAGVLKKSTKL